MIALYPYIQPPPVFPGVNLIDYAFIDGLDEFRPVVTNADIIIACDKNRTGWKFVYHSQRFEDIGKGQVPAQDLRAVGFAVDFRTILVHQLWALVGVSKDFAEWGKQAKPPELVGANIFEGNARCLAPHEGLTASVNVLRLELDYIQRRIQKPIDCSRSTAIRLGTDLIVRLCSLQKRLLEFTNEDWRFKTGKQRSPAVVPRKASDIRTVRETRLHLEQQANLIRVPSSGIDYPKGRFVFTHEGYFEFIFESLRVTEQWLATGELEWTNRNLKRNNNEEE